MHGEGRRGVVRFGVWMEREWRETERAGEGRSGTERERVGVPFQQRIAQDRKPWNFGIVGPLVTVYLMREMAQSVSI